MAVHECGECGATVSRPVVELTDQTLLRGDRPEIGTTGAGEPDRVPEGFKTDSPCEYTAVTEKTGWPILNPEDLVETTVDWEVAIGCCGPDGSRGLNLDCRNGHKVGIERGDCWTTHSVALDPQRVVETDNGEIITEGLDESGPSVWLDTATSGSLSDRRRAIVLLGVHEISDAVPTLVEVLTDGPPELAESTVRTLGRIGDEDAVPALTTVLNATDASLRAEAATALGEIETDRAVQILLERLAEESDPAVCRELRSGVTTRASAEQLQSCFDRAISGQAQETLVRLLRETKGERAVEWLWTVIVDSDVQTSVRECAVGQLTYLNTERSVIHSRLVDTIQAVDEPAVRTECIDRLRYREIDDSEIASRLQTLLDRLRDDPDTAESVRSAAQAYLEG